MKELTLEVPICPFCEEKETELDETGELLLCMDCAIEIGERMDHGAHINNCDW